MSMCNISRVDALISQMNERIWASHRSSFQPPIPTPEEIREQRELTSQINEIYNQSRWTPFEMPANHSLVIDIAGELEPLQNLDNSPE